MADPTLTETNPAARPSCLDRPLAGKPLTSSQRIKAITNPPSNPDAEPRENRTAEVLRSLERATSADLAREVLRRHPDPALRYDRQVHFVSLAAIAVELTRRAQPFATEHKASGDERHYQASCQLAAAAENCRQALQDLGLDPPAGNNP